MTHNCAYRFRGIGIYGSQIKERVSVQILGGLCWPLRLAICHLTPPRSKPHRRLPLFGSRLSVQHSRPQIKQRHPKPPGFALTSHFRVDSTHFVSQSERMKTLSNSRPSLLTCVLAAIALFQIADESEGRSKGLTKTTWTLEK